MKVVVGLGNPGEKYQGTRHNVGFRVVEALRDKIFKSQDPNVKQIPNFKFQTSKKYAAQIWKFNDLLLVKPMTYMNLSGEAVKAVMANSKCQTANLYVVHDDLDIKLGKYKIQAGKGPKDHRGIKSIEAAVGGDFWRVRIGVENRRQDKPREPGEKYVLNDFTVQEREEIGRVIEQAAEELKRVLYNRTGKARQDG